MLPTGQRCAPPVVNICHSSDTRETSIWDPIDTHIMLSLRTCVIWKSVGSLIGWENYQISWQSEQIMQHSAQILKTCRLQSNIASSAKCDSSILIYRRNNNLVHVCHVCCMNPELVLFYAHKSIQKIPSEMEVAPRYNCWHCWRCWHCWQCWQCWHCWHSWHSLHCWHDA